MQSSRTRRAAKILFGLAVFATLATAILLRTPKWLSDFDQSFYITVAYDIVHHGVFSNGVFDKVDSTRSVPPPGRFFGPVYPAFVAAMMKLDPRFARSVACNIEVNAGSRPGSDCEIYVRPIHLAHAALLAVGVVFIALTAELILGTALAFWVAGILAAAALLPDADLFSFVMTESLTFCLYSLAAWALVWSIKAPALGKFLVAGLLLGVLVLTRTVYAVLVVVVPILIIVGCARGIRPLRLGGCALSFLVGCTVVIGPWMARNAVSAGGWGLTEEYGSAAIIERFAFNDMTTREFFLSFAYCLPVVGEPLVETAFGPKAMERFVYYSANSFFHAGRGIRDKLVEAHGKLDPLIGDIMRNEVQENGLRHLLVSVALGWCGMWVGGALGLLLVPLFPVAIAMARGAQLRLLLIYAAPAFAMLGMHALVGNHYTRYNLILIGPLAAAAALALSVLIARRGERRAATG